ncbi:uncharacterized protein BDR25DRAFT_103577 [Lindgomyces ingoldianus]|uniref:Uncharacterized protein n=1 Tax=Lindgomyces ingoldianus TaxID=673940 RepID=A0ACB6R8X4_9PLEO|nr:uncharacterized protein BDR25DRAFT_103577 [Lindgomyces ingoldianus]KAF2475547.1 hypothetical protein BDR25DRAFT_103577 [Lindgomyces ingoldianus]
MEAVCSNRMSFLSHVSVACVYQDVGESLLEDSPLTVYAKTKVLQMIKDSLQGFDTQTDDFTILSILHLLISECGGFDEDVFDVHQEGLVRIIYQRGGIGNLGMNGKIAAFMTLTILSFTILRGLSEPAMLHGFVPSQRPSIVSEYPPPISPLYAPNGDLSAIYGHCSDSTYELLCDMHDITRTFIARWNYISGAFTPRSSSELASYDTHMGEIYTRLLYRPRTDEDLTPDYVYESCRLAGLIYCRSLVQGLPLSESGNVMYARSSGVNIGEGYSSRSSNTTIISALHDALDSTDKSDSWCAMCGVFIWICFVGGAASWPSTHSVYGERGDVQVPAAWVRKCFALYTVKAGLSLGFERAAAIAEAQRTMLQVQNLINLKRGIASQ